MATGLLMNLLRATPTGGMIDESALWTKIRKIMTTEGEKMRKII
jgi:hypothetical protein